MTDIAQRLFDASVRFDKLIWLAASATDSGATSEDFRDFCENIPDSVDESDPLLEALPTLKEYAEGDEYPDPEEVAQKLIWAHKVGYLALAATPVMRWWPDGQGAEFSWGHYNTKWLYGETPAAVAAAALKWAKRCRAKEKATLRKAA